MRENSMYVTADVEIEDVLGELSSSDMIKELARRDEYNNTDIFYTHEERTDEILDNINIIDMLYYIETSIDKLEVSIHQKMEINVITERLHQKTKG